MKLDILEIDYEGGASCKYAVYLFPGRRYVLASWINNSCLRDQEVVFYGLIQKDGVHFAVVQLDSGERWLVDPRLVFEIY